MKYDVIIVGTGPGGVAAALSCYNAGLKVLVITKTGKKEEDKTFPTQSIHPGIISLLEKINLEQVVEHASIANYDGTIVNGTFNPLSPEQEHWEGWHINRIKFDNCLLDGLYDKNIRVVTDEIKKIEFVESDQSLNITTKIRKKIETKLLIDASGHKRKMGRMLSLKEVFLSPPLTAWTGVSEFNGKTNHQNCNPSFVSEEWGWLWVAPESNTLFTWTKLIVNKKKPFNNPFPNSKLVSEIYPNNVRWRVFRPVCHKNVLLCGDAAGILDPAAGQGILMALWAGMMAGSTVIAAIQKPTLVNYFFTQYDQWFINQYEDKISKLRKYYSEMNIKFS